MQRVRLDRIDRHILADLQREGRITNTAGVGALIGENRLDVGTFGFKETNWHLAIAPEAGVSYALNRDFAIFGQGRYTYGFKTRDVSPAFFNFNVGLAWRN